ncbi:MAG: hypothetical protein JSW73_02050, partial [Candidatus Woesearchaeota archaeon]
GKSKTYKVLLLCGGPYAVPLNLSEDTRRKLTKETERAPLRLETDELPSDSLYNLYKFEGDKKTPDTLGIVIFKEDESKDNYYSVEDLVLLGSENNAKFKITKKGKAL